MKLQYKVPLIAAGVAAGFFVVTFGIYMANLDMKAMTLIEPFLMKHYDTMPRKQYV